eukprot:4145400-Karenia_brevis.AAC.1
MVEIIIARRQATPEDVVSISSGPSDIDVISVSSTDAASDADNDDIVSVSDADEAEAASDLLDADDRPIF